MKKRKGLKIFLIISIVCILSGFAFLGAGIVKGGSLRYLSVSSDTVSWWPWKHAGIGFDLHELSYDEDDVEWFDDSYEHRGYRYDREHDFGKLSSVVIDANAGNIYISAGSKNQLRYSSKNEDTVRFEEVDGKLNIQVEHRGNRHKNAAIYVSLTRDTLENLDVSLAAGNIYIEQIRTKKLALSSEAGNIEAEDIYSEQSNIEQVCGNLDIEGEFLNKTSIVNAAGNTEVNLRGRASDYYIQAVNHLGNSEVFDREYSGSAEVSQGNATASNHVWIENELGNLEVDMED